MAEAVLTVSDQLSILESDSFGAHIAGVAGKQVKRNTNKLIGRITGLDPAGPCFSNVYLDGRLDKEDAEYVDVIHTNAGILGINMPITGHTDFYFNNGISQLGCFLPTCDQSPAWENTLNPLTLTTSLELKDGFEHDPTWRKTGVGCLILQLLQDMFEFNISYLEDDQILTMAEKQQNIVPRLNDSVDIYIQPMELQKEDLEIIYPIQSIFMWRFGFILSRRYNGFFRKFYSEPFTNSVWFCIYIMILIASLLFYVLSLWDFKQYGGECSFVLELLLAFSAYCQHSMLYTDILSFLFILCAYIVHTFYTSNLLTQLVMDTDVAMDLESLAKSNYEFAVYKDMNLNIDKQKYEMVLDKNLSIVWNKLQTVKVLSLMSAVRALMEERTAVMTDYIELYPILKKNFEMNDICHLIEIDLYSNVNNYLFTSKSFQYKDEFKVGTLRIKEAGLIRRQLAMDKYSRPQCKPTVNHYNTQWEHTAALLTVLLIVYTLAILVMLVEKIHYQRNKVWPYIE